MSLSTTAQRILRVLRDTGPRPLTMLAGFVDSNERELQRVVGELFIAGVVEWQSAKRWRLLAARKRAG